MATPESSPAVPPSAQVVGNAFVEQYYHILHHSPELVHRFYQDSSALSRPDASGSMTTVFTMKAINEKILSLNFEEYTAEIKTADAQYSFEKGVIVLVTGCLTGKDEVKKKFTQSFFLAPQDKGFYVLNDVFRFVEESETAQVESASINAVSEIAEEASQPVEQVAEPTHVPDHLVVEQTTPYEEEENLNNEPEVCDPSENEDEHVIEEEAIETPTISTENIIISKSIDIAPEVQEDAPKKSYASILKEIRANTTPTPTHVPNRAVRPAAINTEQQSVNSEKPAPPVEAPPVPSESVASEGESVHEVEGHSIYVRNLPYDATVEQLEEEFKKFGPIKREGVQVRSSKLQGFCFGFVEFESMTSMQSALESSPITIGDRQAVIEEKRTSTRGGGGRGKFSSGRGGFRGRASFGRNYGGRSGEYRTEYSARGRGSSSSSSGGYQRQNGARPAPARPTGPPNARSAVVS